MRHLLGPSCYALNSSSSALASMLGVPIIEPALQFQPVEQTIASGKVSTLFWSKGFQRFRKGSFPWGDVQAARGRRAGSPVWQARSRRALQQPSFDHCSTVGCVSFSTVGLALFV
jgi:hypothetical protein